MDVVKGYFEGTKFIIEQTGKKYLLLGYIQNKIKVELEDLEESFARVINGISVSERVIDFITREDFIFSYLVSHSMLLCEYKENMYKQQLNTYSVMTYKGLSYTVGTPLLCGTPSPLFKDWLLKNKMIDSSLRELITYDEMFAMYERFHNEHYDTMRDSLYDLMIDKSCGVNGLYLYGNDILYREDGEYFHIAEKPLDKVDLISFVHHFDYSYINVQKYIKDENKVDVGDKNGLLWRINQL